MESYQVTVSQHRTQVTIHARLNVSQQGACSKVYAWLYTWQSRVPAPLLVIDSVSDARYTQSVGVNVNEFVMSCTDGCAVILMVIVTAAGLPETVLPVSGST